MVTRSRLNRPVDAVSGMLDGLENALRDSQLRTSSSAAVGHCKALTMNVVMDIDGQQACKSLIYWLYRCGSPHWAMVRNWLIREAA